MRIVLPLFLFVAFIQLALSEEHDGCVMVTGASGFVAGHVVEYLLEKNYTVHGTVRDPKSENAKFLERVAKPLPGRLNLFKANLKDDRPFDTAIEGCTGMIHLASVVMANGISHEDQVLVSVKGTISALEAARRARVKSVVVTSSDASIFPTKKKIGTQQLYDISDDNDVASLHYGTYPYSKVQAEQATQVYMKHHGDPFKLATIHFPLALGPQQNKRVTSSNMVIEHLMAGELPFFVLPLQFNIIDVRDVARAHVYALESENAKGRYLVASSSKKASMSMLEIADVLRKKYETYPISQYHLPVWVYSWFIYFDARTTPYDVDLAASGRHPGYDGTKLTKDTGFEYMHLDPEQTILDCAESFIQYGIVNGEARILDAVLYSVLGGTAFVVLVLAKLCGLFCRASPPQDKNKKNE